MRCFVHCRACFQHYCFEPVLFFHSSCHLLIQCPLNFHLSHSSSSRRLPASSYGYICLECFPFKSLFRSPLRVALSSPFSLCFIFPQSIYHSLIGYLIHTSVSCARILSISRAGTLSCLFCVLSAQCRTAAVCCANEDSHAL